MVSNQLITVHKMGVILISTFHYTVTVCLWIILSGGPFLPAAGNFGGLIQYDTARTYVLQLYEQSSSEVNCNKKIILI